MKNLSEKSDQSLQKIPINTGREALSLRSSWSSLFKATYHWIIQHDDSKIFVVLYIALAVTLSIFISLFWLVFVVGVHFIFEWLRQRHLLPDGGFQIFARVLWELKLDIALILFAFVVTVYMEFILGVAGLSAASRLGQAGKIGLKGGTKFAGWQRAIRGFLLSVDDAAQVLRSMSGVKKSGASNNPNNPEAKHISQLVDGHEKICRWGGWQAEWSCWDRISLAFAVLCFLLLGIAPWVTEHTFFTVLHAISLELRPFP